MADQKRRSRFIGFFQLVQQDDGYGNVTSGFAETPNFIVQAEVRPRFGTEALQAAHLSSKKYVVITVRSADFTREVKEDWKARDMCAGIDYNIRSIIDPDGMRRWREMWCEEGVAT